MSGVNLTINQQQVSAASDALSALVAADTSDFFTLVGEYILAETLINFDQEQTPEGEAWTPSQRALDENGKTLQHTRRLYQSYTYTADDDAVEVGSNVVYAAIHHFGGQTGKGHATDIEARPALGLTPEMGQQVTELYMDWARGILL